MAFGIYEAISLYARASYLTLPCHSFILDSKSSIIHLTSLTICPKHISVDITCHNSSSRSRSARTQWKRCRVTAVAPNVVVKRPKDENGMWRERRVFIEICVQQRQQQQHWATQMKNKRIKQRKCVTILRQRAKEESIYAARVTQYPHSARLFHLFRVWFWLVGDDGTHLPL